MLLATLTLKTGETQAWWDSLVKRRALEMIAGSGNTPAPALTSNDFERVKQAKYKSSLNGGNTGQSSGNWHRLSPGTRVRVNTALRVWVRAMSKGGYLLFKESSYLQVEECQPRC
jgi:hypothetical protein